jgi:hypothetical protein
MKKKDDTRRSFLKHVLAGSAVVAGTALTSKNAKARQVEAEQRPDEVLYRESEEFKKYYESLQ